MHATSLPASVSAPGIARSRLDGWLSAALSEGDAERVRLGVSELISNAVLHGEPSWPSTIDLAVDVGAEAVRVDVTQASSTGAAAVIAPEFRGDIGGFGLAIVEDVADRWGVEPGPPGSVWFEIDRHG